MTAHERAVEVTSTNDEVVWAICNWLRNNAGCRRCPGTVLHPKHGETRRGCRAQTEEGIQQVLRAAGPLYAKTLGFSIFHHPV